MLFDRAVSKSGPSFYENDPIDTHAASEEYGDERGLLLQDAWL
jgi:hypothetical protein